MATMTNLNELQYFALVAQSRSFTLAARRLNVPKSSVSRTIVSLERRLDVQLIERTTRRVRLTEAGRLYLTHCQRVLEEAEQADIAIGAMMAIPKGKLRIGAPVAFARFVLGPLMNEFLATYPELRVHIELLHARERERDEDFDVVVRVGPLEDSGWLVKPLMRVRLGLYASPAFIKRHRRPESPADLQRYACIVASCGPQGEPEDFAMWRLKREREVREVQVIARVSVPDPSVHHQLALAGAGIATLGQAEVISDLKQRRLARILPEWEPEPIELYALYPSRLATSPKVRVLLDFLGKHCNDAYKLEGLLPDSEKTSA
jgi:DNA-binding transcriptional LysR family regulator